MRMTVKMWGNSAAVRLPASVMEAADLAVDTDVEVRVEDGRVVIEPIRTPRHDLAALIAKITPENQHNEVDFGAPVGRELL